MDILAAVQTLAEQKLYFEERCKKLERRCKDLEVIEIQLRKSIVDLQMEMAAFKGGA